MGRLNVGGTQSGTLSQIDELATADLPVDSLPQAPEQAPEVEAAPPGGALDALFATPQAQGYTAGSVEDVASGVAEGVFEQAEQEEAFSIPDLKSRLQDEGRVDVWVPTGAAKPGVPSDDGGFIARAKNLQELYDAGAINVGITPTGDISGAAIEAAHAGKHTSIDPIVIANAAAQQNPGSLIAAMNRAGAVNQEFANPEAIAQGQPSRVAVQGIDPAYLQIGALVTENNMAMLAQGEADTTQDAVLPEDESLKQIKPEQAVHTTVSRAQGNEQIGQQIHKEYQRYKNPGRTPEPLSKEEATTLGHAFKAMYSAANPDMVKPIKVGDQVHYQFTPEGLEALQQGSIKRKRMFPSLHVRPNKSASPLQGDIAQEVKDYLGAVKKPAGQQILKEAVNNMNKIPNVVDKQRAKILLSTILPVLNNQSQLDPTIADTFAEINNIGPSKQAQFDAAEAADPEYSAAENMAALRESVAQSVRAVAMERDGANYLTYAIQAFNGRISPQQSTFDPSSSKAVRFVTRNAVPAKASPGSRVERNLRQMYAMMLVKGADDKLPPVREDMLTAATPQLAAWGKRLIEVLDQTMSDAEYEAISNAIAEGKPLQDPAYQALRPLALDPQRDADLIKAIKDKGEDGPHFIDGLIDFAKYEHAKRAKKPYYSYFNAYMDGKTNGIASNAIQLGTEQTARQTGVLRDNEVSLLDDGDIREALKQTLLQEITDNGWDGDWEGLDTEVTLVGKAIAQHRDLNKHTTMTFGYGKDTDTFGEDIAASMGELEQIALKAERDGDTETLDKKALNGYVAALNAIRVADKEGNFVDAMTIKTDLGLRQVMSPEAIEARGIMRSAAVTHAMMNKLFSIGTYTGFELNLGRLQSLAWDEGKTSEYDIEADVVSKTGSITNALPGASITPDGAIEYEVQPEFVDWLSDRIETGVFPAVKAAKSPESLRETFSREVADWLVLNAGLGKPGKNRKTDYIDDKGKRIDIKVVRPGMRAFQIEQKQVDSFKEKGEVFDYIEVWEADVWPTTGGRLGELKAGDKIKIRPVGRMTPSQYYNEATPVRKSARTDAGTGQATFAWERAYDPSTLSAPIKLSDTHRRAAQRMKVGQYESEPTAAAIKSYTDSTGEVVNVPGGHAVGGSLPGPIQSLDAATVAMTVTGQSWDKLRAASNGNPYIHTIYDAFKVDAMGYDVVLEEVNANWLKAGMEWSYLKETKEALTKAYTEFNKEMDARDPNSKLSDNEKLYMMWALEPKETMSGKILPMNLIKQLDKTDSAKFDDETVWKALQRIDKKMQDVGFNYKFPPAEPTAKQLKTFVNAIRDEMNLGSRLTRMINHTEKQKAALAKKIKDSGVPVYQYYAH